MNICEAMICDYGETNNEILANKQMSLKPIGGFVCYIIMHIACFRYKNINNYRMHLIKNDFLL